MLDAVFLTSPLSFAARFRKNCARIWAERLSAATSARMCARGTAKLPRRALAEFLPRRIDAPEDSHQPAENGRSLFLPELEWLASLTQEDFSRIFRGSAVKRAKWRGLVRNACVSLGNAQMAPGSEPYRRISLLLSRLADSDDGLIAEHARWALARLALQGPLVGFSG